MYIWLNASKLSNFSKRQFSVLALFQNKQDVNALPSSSGRRNCLICQWYDTLQHQVSVMKVIFGEKMQFESEWKTKIEGKKNPLHIYQPEHVP